MKQLKMFYYKLSKEELKLADELNEYIKTKTPKALVLQRDINTHTFIVATRKRLICLII